MNRRDLLGTMTGIYNSGYYGKEQLYMKLGEA